METKSSKDHSIIHKELGKAMTVTPSSPKILPFPVPKLSALVSSFLYCLVYHTLISGEVNIQILSPAKLIML